MSVFQIAVRGQHSLHYKTVWIHVRRHSDISVSSEDSIDLHVFECCSDPCTEASGCRSGPLQRAEQMKMRSYTSPSQIRRFGSIFGGNGLIVMLMLFFGGLHILPSFLFHGAFKRFLKINVPFVESRGFFYHPCECESGSLSRLDLPLNSDRLQPPTAALCSLNKCSSFICQYFVEITGR